MTAARVATAMVTGALKCDNCSTTLHLNWVVVKQELRGHHVDLDCPLCGDDKAFHAWLAQAKAKGQTFILLHVDAGNR